jgi:hypothetical protein
VQLYPVFKRAVCVIATLLRARLAALPPLRLVVVCGVVDGGARVDKTVNCIIYVACEDLRAPHLARRGAI